MKKLTKNQLLVTTSLVTVSSAIPLVVSCSESSYFTFLDNKAFELGSSFTLNDKGSLLTANHFREEAIKNDNFAATMALYTKNWNEFNSKLESLGGVLINPNPSDIVVNDNSIIIKLNIHDEKSGKNEIINFGITGFTSNFVYYRDNFNNIVNSISLKIQDEQKGKEIIDVVNETNIRTYINGLPDVDNNFSITNLKLNKSEENGIKGQIGISFTYSFDKTFVSSSVSFSKEINQVVTGFKEYGTFSSENFNSISSKVNAQSKYFDSIIVSGESKSNWLTSYFGYDILENQNLNSDYVKSSLKKLFNIPLDIFGVDFILNSIKYSYTDSSLSNTELKISFTFSNKYDSTEKIERTETLGGFYDPYTDIMYKTAQAKNKDFNYNSRGHGTAITQINKYNNLPEELKFGNANWQSTWAQWGLYSPWSDFNFIGTGVAANWINFADEKGQKIIEYYGLLSSGVKYNLSWSSPSSNDWYTTGNVDQDGIAYFPWIMNLVLNTYTSDKRNNISAGKYNSLDCTNVVVCIPGKNNYWK